MPAFRVGCSALVCAGLLLFVVGSPGVVRAGPAAGYYAPVNASSPAFLRATLHDVIDDHQRFPYTSTATDSWDILEQVDENPANTSEILDVYMNASLPKFGGGGGGYNREHTWPSSYGFPNDGSTNYPYSDCHHLFLSDDGYNSSRSNKLYGQCDASCAERVTVANGGVGGTLGVYPGESNWTKTGVWQTWSERQGDVARALMYLDLRYEGGNHGVTGAPEPDLVLTDDANLVATSGTNASLAYMGELSVLLAWHAADPVDAREQLRNDIIESYQGNRNPLIDHPEWAACLFAGSCSASGIPGAPSGFRTLSTDGPVELDWNDNLEPDLAGYRVKRALTPGGPYVDLQLGLLALSEFSDVSAKTGWLYYYVVTAEDSDGDESVPSGELAIAVASSPWINEIHYDNASTDQDEGFEIAGLAGIDLSGWQVVTYNGSNGSVTTSVALSGLLPDDGSGYGFVFFPAASLQNGPADALALVDPSGNVLEFLSYEGSLVAVGGPADGLVSTDIGVSESNAVPVGYSMQRQGHGSHPEDFSWAAPAPHTRGAVNTGQTLAIPIPVPMFSSGALVVWAAFLLGSGAWMASRAKRLRVRPLR